MLWLSISLESAQVHEPRRSPKHTCHTILQLVGVVRELDAMAKAQGKMQSVDPETAACMYIELSEPYSWQQYRLILMNQ